MTNNSIAFIGIGSNMGSKENNIKKAINLISKTNKIIKKSKLYETEPVGYKKQEWFLNCVIKIETELKVEELLTQLLKIEKDMKRIREIKNGPRIIDLDILFFNNAKIKTNTLTIPHPEIENRRFVLIPLNEIEPDFIHPVFKKTMNQLLKENSTNDKCIVHK